jgi:hypothetical protein
LTKAGTHSEIVSGEIEVKKESIPFASTKSRQINKLSDSGLLEKEMGK